MSGDFDAITLALKNKDFAAMNIFANRLTSNAFLVASREAAISGFLAKQVALDGLAAQRTKESSRIHDTAASQFLKQLRGSMPDSQDPGKKWKAYTDYANEARKALVDDVEREAYKQDEEFVAQCHSTLMSIFRNEWKILVDPKNAFTKGILNEAARLTRVHGAREREVLLQVTLKAFDAYYDYAALSSSLPDETYATEALVSKVEPFVKRVLELFGQDGVQTGVPDYKALDLLVGDLVFEWRKHFIYYMEQQMVMPGAERKRIELPEEARRKISDIISEALKREVKGS